MSPKRKRQRLAALQKQKQESPTPRHSAGYEGWVVLLGLLLVIGFNSAIRWRLASVPLERDEGEYAYGGQLLLQGIPPYKLAYNMKFPGVYVAYSLLMAVFGEDIRGIHIGMACVTSLTALLVFGIGCKLFHRWGGLMAAAGFVWLSATPEALGLAGHATHFVALFAAAGTLALLHAGERPTWGRWWLAGLMYGLAILMKQHAIILAATGLAWLVAWHWQHRTAGHGQRALRSAATFAAGCASPVFLTALWLAVAGVWHQFIFWTIQYSMQYVTAASIQTAWAPFVSSFRLLFTPTWLLWCLGLIGIIACLPIRRDWNKSAAVFLFVGGMLAIVPGYRFREHYYLMAMPGLALLIAALPAAALSRMSQSGKLAGRIAFGGLFLAVLGLTAWNNRQVWFELSPEQVTRRLYASNPFAESIPIADYLREHTRPDERIAVMGSEPQIYFYARRHSATGYIYMYALTEPHRLGQQMRDQFEREMETANPRYVVFVDVAMSWVSLIHVDNSVQLWWFRFSQNYEPVAAATLSENAPSTYCWDAADVRKLDPAGCHVVVYRRIQ